VQSRISNVALSVRSRNPVAVIVAVYAPGASGCVDVIMCVPETGK
jgi:hypothetical protein